VVLEWCWNGVKVVSETFEETLVLQGMVMVLQETVIM
jgi:hypothetical protein